VGGVGGGESLRSGEQKYNPEDKVVKPIEKSTIHEDDLGMK
jgi:hypothetical protein